MPKKPIDYSKIVIYLLAHNEDYDYDKCYIGSTCNFTQRKYTHKTACNSVIHKCYNNKKYVYIRENGGWDNWNMIEIEKYPCIDSKEAKKMEEYHRKHYNAILNTRRCHITDEEKGTYTAEYYQLNKEKISEYYQLNKEKILEYQNQYNQINKEKIKQYQRDKYACKKDFGTSRKKII